MDTSILSIREWKRADSLVAAHPKVTDAQLRAADHLVDSTWNGIPPGATARRRVPLYVTGFIMIAVPSMLLSFGAALFARRGLLMRSLGLELVNHKREPAGRLRLVWRQLLIWVPLCALSFVPTVWWAAQDRVTPKAIAFCTVTCLLVAGSLFTTWRTPSRGLTERLSGTAMVPE